MDMINRTFVGIRVPVELHETIERAVLLLKRKPGILDMRWNQSSEYMLSLVSLGELSIQTLSMLKDPVADALRGEPPFEVTLEKFVGVPNMIQPRFAVLQFGGDRAENTRRLAEKIDVATKPLTPLREGRPFQPHLIVGRLKTESDQMRVALGRALKFPEHEPFGTWRITEIELLISAASTAGIGYKAVETFPLEG
ncbi:MAG: RNA 2',3'-cyclic phosphodiesterase [Armatimonadetes bacterium]|nr:RNA 2',3'-cyclic phosphodiesterase [Armatimonadota bacterium]